MYLFFRFLLKSELETPQVVGVFEEAIQDDLLVLLYDSIFALNESGEEP